MIVEGMRIALVTGANKGIGKEISRQLSTKGVHVLMGARDQQRGEKAVAELRAHQIPVEFLNIDVTSQTSVDAAASEVKVRHGRLDILVNNAGIAMDLLPGSELTMEVLQKTFETNVFGVFRVTKAMLPLLRESKRARIVNMTSGNGSFSFYTNPQVPLPDRNTLLAYSSSKAALNMITLRLAYELSSAGIKVNAADPGSTATEMNQYRGRGTVEEGAAAAVRLAELPDDGPTGGVFGSAGPEPW
jgi:NAD(P)-dependent dehydrogenase (short-subunit alcohol dehydrogenase family)